MNTSFVARLSSDLVAILMHSIYQCVHPVAVVPLRPHIPYTISFSCTQAVARPPPKTRL
ncbi:hypothetical protein DENSPDRAFT_846391, partial [Dentipellis sp. KUC8613]